MGAGSIRVPQFTRRETSSACTRVPRRASPARSFRSLLFPFTPSLSLILALVRAHCDPQMQFCNSSRSLTKCPAVANELFGRREVRERRFLSFRDSRVDGINRPRDRTASIRFVNFSSPFLLTPYLEKIAHEALRNSWIAHDLLLMFLIRTPSCLFTTDLSRLRLFE